MKFRMPRLSRTTNTRRRQRSDHGVEVLEKRLVLFANNHLFSHILEGGPVELASPVHENITDEALSFLDFTARLRIVKANVEQDTGALGGSNNVFNFDDETFHFDNSNFTGTAQFISKMYGVAVAAADPDNFNSETIAAAFGRLLHSVQDFYAHSNWVNHFGDSKLVDSDFGPWPSMEAYTQDSNGIVFVQGPVPDGFTVVQLPDEPFKVFVDKVAVDSENPGFNTQGIVSGETTLFGFNQAPLDISISHGALNHDHGGDGCDLSDAAEGWKFGGESGTGCLKPI